MKLLWKYLIILLVSVSSFSSFAKEISDLVVIMDTSGSMDEFMTGKDNESVTKIDYAKKKISQMLGKFAIEEKFSLRMITFQDSPIIHDYGVLTKDSFDGKINPKIMSLDTWGGTPLASSIRVARDMFLSSSNSNREQSLIILSDGIDDGGIEPVRSAMDDLVSKTSGQVMVQFFALGVNKQVWQDFSSLASIIQLGTLFLIDSGDSGGDYFNLSYDAISGDWSSDKIRSEVGKRLGDVHAEKVHVISNFDKHAKRDPDYKLKSIDWNALRIEEPALFEEMRSWLEDIEVQFHRTTINGMVDYLITNVIRPSIGHDAGITNQEAYLTTVKEKYKNFKIDFSNRKKFFNSKGFKEAAINFGTNSLLVSNFLGGNSRLVSAYASIESLGYGLTAEFEDALTDPKDGLENLFGVSYIGGLLTTAVTFPLIIGPVADKIDIGPKISFLLWGGSMVAGSSAMSFSGATNDLATNAGINLEAQQNEYKRYEQFVEREETLKILQRALPSLDQDQIFKRVTQAGRQTSDPVKRALIIFAGNQKITERVLAASLIAEELSKGIEDGAVSSIDITALRENGSLPTDIQAYLNLLMRNIDNDEFDSNVELFLRGVK